MSELGKKKLEALYIERARLRLVSLWRQSPVQWLRAYDPTEERPVLWTLDSHDKEHPVKPFTPTMPALTLAVAWSLPDKRVIAVRKSRQMLISWTSVMLLLHSALFFEGQLILVMSKHKGPTIDLLDRFKHVYKNLPHWLREMFPTSRPINDLPKVELSFDHMSKIQGLPRGAEQLRMYTASVVWFDEFAFIHDQEACLEAAVPTISGGGKLLVISTPMPDSYFRNYIEPLKTNKKLRQTATLIRDKLSILESRGLPF